ncbi:MAG: WbqC family protein [Ignavibacteria bacterium]|nr:WbqC family protein [Ignavibacteria bacterium]
MKIAIMQPYLFPYLGYFQLINYADKFIILDDVQFINSGWINRNYILHSKEKLLFTVPVKQNGSRSDINKVLVSLTEARKRKLLKSFYYNYLNAPFFTTIFPMIENLLSGNITGISKLALSGIVNVNKYLNIDTQIIESSEIYDNKELKGQNRIIDICKKENADEYINLSGGVGLYKYEDFKLEGIELKFIKSRDIKYKQYYNEFVGPLSIIDNLMFNSPEQVRKSLLEIDIL